MKLKAILADNAYLLKIVFRHARGYAALTVCTAILIAADNVAANALMPRYLTDALARRAPLREICSVLALSFDGLFDNEINHFVECIETGKPCRNPAQDGVTLMKILDGIYESARTGHEVLL